MVFIGLIQKTSIDVKSEKKLIRCSIDSSNETGKATQ